MQSTASPFWTHIAFTGHRALGDEDLIAESIGSAIDKVVTHCGPVIGRSSAASGSDTLFLEQMALRENPCYIVLPFHLERFQQDFTEAQWRRTKALIASASALDVIEVPSNDDDAYLEAGHACIDRAHIVVAVWDAQPAKGRGGTGDAVAFARRLQKPLIIIDPQTGERSEERTEKLFGSTPSGDTNKPARHEPPEGGWGKSINDNYDRLDTEATRIAPRARQLLLLIIVLHLIATAAAFTPSVLHLKQPGWDLSASFVKVAGLVFALLLALRHHHRHHEWIEARAKAELYRAFQAIWPMRRANSCPIKHPPPRLNEEYQSLRTQWNLAKDEEAEFSDAKRHYLRTRLKKQIVYYKRNYKKALARYKVLSKIAHISTILAIVIALFPLYSQLAPLLSHDDGHGAGHGHGTFYYSAKLMSILLPLLSAALLSAVVGRDLSRRASRYGEITDALVLIRKRYKNAQTWSGISRLTRQSERILLQEIGEWRAMTEYAGEAH